MLMRIERYLARTGTPPTRFGLLAAGDRSLVFDLRRGREPRAAMLARLARYLDQQEGTRR